MDFKTLINYNIKQIRLKSGLSQEKFAEKIGLTAKGISNIERNQYSPTAGTIDKICEAFNVTPDVLCRPLDLPKSKSDLINHIDAVLYSLDTDDLKQIYKIIATYSE